MTLFTVSGENGIITKAQRGRAVLRLCPADDILCAVTSSHGRVYTASQHSNIIYAVGNELLYAVRCVGDAPFKLLPWRDRLAVLCADTAELRCAEDGEVQAFVFIGGMLTGGAVDGDKCCVLSALTSELNVLKLPTLEMETVRLKFTPAAVAADGEVYIVGGNEDGRICRINGRNSMEAQTGGVPFAVCLLNDVAAVTCPSGIYLHSRDTLRAVGFIKGAAAWGKEKTLAVHDGQAHLRIICSGTETRRIRLSCPADAFIIS